MATAQPVPDFRPCPVVKASAAPRRLVVRDTPAPALRDLFGPHWLPDTLSDDPPARRTPTKP